MSEQPTILCETCGASELDQTGKCAKCKAQATLKAYGFSFRKTRGGYLLTKKDSVDPLASIHGFYEVTKKNVQKITGAPLEVVEATFAALELQEERDAEQTEQKKQTKPEKVERILTPEEKAKVEGLLNDPNLLNHALTLGKIKIIGEDDVLLQNFVILASGQTPYPISSVIMGYSGSGKNQSIRAVTPLIPEEWIFEFKATTPEAVKYIPESFSGTLIIYEAAAMRSETSTLGLRAVGEGESIETIYPMRDEETGKMTLGRAKTNAKNFITTDSGLDIFADLYRRVLKISMNDSDELTRRVMAKKLRDAALPESLKIKMKWQTQQIPFSPVDFQNALRALDLKAEVVVFPPSRLLKLANLAIKKEQRVALRTQIERVLYFVKILALIRQNNRIRFKDTNNPNNRYVIASAEDVEDALTILNKSISETISRIERRQAEALEIFKKTPLMDKNILADKLKVSSVTAAKILKTLSNNGYLKENQTSKPFKYEVSEVENKSESFVLSEIITDYKAFHKEELKTFLNRLFSSCISCNVKYNFLVPEEANITTPQTQPLKGEETREKEPNKPEIRLESGNKEKSLIFPERTKKKADFLFERIKPSQPCDCGNNASEYKVTILNDPLKGDVLFRCEACFQSLRAEFHNAVWQPKSEVETA